MASINVKVPVKKVVDALEAKVKELKAHPAKEKAFAVAKEKWEKDVVALIPAGAPALDISTSTASYHVPRGFTKVTVSYQVRTSSLPKEPEQEHETFIYNRRETQIQEIENALRLLKMTDETHVNASTFKSISKFL